MFQSKQIPAEWERFIPLVAKYTQLQIVCIEVVPWDNGL